MAALVRAASKARKARPGRKANADRRVRSANPGRKVIQDARVLMARVESLGPPDCRASAVSKVPAESKARAASKVRKAPRDLQARPVLRDNCHRSSR